MLSIPEIPADADTISAALAYADAGWYVLPVERNPDDSVNKNPGSVVGKGWPAKSSREHDVIVSWFAGTNHTIALHCGRSGAVVFDVDTPENLPGVLRRRFGVVPFQHTRPEIPNHGHYVFATPPGRTLGNSVGSLKEDGKGWGDVRGNNGVIIVAPAPGGRRWIRTGPVPPLPDAIAEKLPDGSSADDAATDEQVKAFFVKHRGTERLELIPARVTTFARQIERNEGHHTSAIVMVVGAMKEAAAGYFPASDADAALKPVFINAVALGGSTGRKRVGAVAECEWKGIRAWAIGQANAADLDEVRKRVAEKMPRDRIGMSPAEFLGFGKPESGQPVTDVTPEPDADSGQDSETSPEPDVFETQVGIRLDKLRVDREAKRRLDENQTAPLATDLLTPTDLRNLADPEPLITDVLDQGTVALLYGQWGGGKTFLALDWAASIATGRPWQGRATVRRQALYIATEGPHGMKARVSAWETGWQRKLDDDDLHILRRAVNLTSCREVDLLCELVAANGYGLIVIDTLSRCMVGADENSAQDCGKVVAALGQLRDATPDGRGVVLGVHHTGKDGKTFRGSSVFEAGADTVYSVTTDDDGMITVDREKRRDGPREDTHDLRLDPMPGTGSCVLSRGAQNTPNGLERLTSADSLYSTFMEHFGASGASNTQLEKVSGMSTGSYYRARNYLLEHGKLTNTGSDSRPYYLG
jgi:AAA domain/Bifunctional DNA primase/polymerase, N-terminal